METNYSNILRAAQAAALKQHRGEKLSPAQTFDLNQGFDLFGPEGVYMDGELFA